MPLKIAIVTEYYYPLLGGITENVHNTARRLTARGHDVTIVTSGVPPDGLSPSERQADAARVVRIGRSIPLRGNGSVAHATIGLHLWRDLRRLFLAERFDIAHLHSPLVFTLPALSIRATPCPTVGTFHTYFKGSRVYQHTHGILQKYFVDKLDAITGVSQSCIDSLVRYFRIPDPRIVPNGIDVEAFRPDVPRVGKFDRSKFTLLFLGRFEPRNGFSLMLEAFTSLRRARSDVRLVVAGDGSTRARYEHRVPAALRQDVHFEGSVLASRPAYYATCDVFCSPIDKASFGITLLEAMASGRPIVATENVGYLDLLQDDEGLLVPPNDADAFARAVLALLDDPARREQMGEAGRRRALEFSWDRVVTKTLDLYEEVLARP